MDTRVMTLNEIRKTGIETLTENLGVVGMIRFLQQSETGWGDYTKDRSKWLGKPSLKKIYTEIQTIKEK